MKVILEGIEDPIVITEGKISVLEIENQTWFCRVCQALRSGLMEKSVEPYSLWDENGSELPASSYELIMNPLELPWKSRHLTTGVLDLLAKMVIESEETRSQIELVSGNLFSLFSNLSYQLSSDYSFGVEWDVKKYLKAFGFEIEVDTEGSLLDNLIVFLNALRDVGWEKLLIIVNLKSFLNRNDLELFYEHVLFTKTKLLLLEQRHRGDLLDHEIKMHVNRQFLSE